MLLRTKDYLNVEVEVKGANPHIHYRQKNIWETSRLCQMNSKKHSRSFTILHLDLYPCQTFQPAYISIISIQASIPYLDTLRGHVMSYFEGETPRHVVSLTTRHGVKVVALHPPQRHQHSEPGKVGRVPFHKHDLLVRMQTLDH